MTYRFEKGTVYTDRKLVVLKQRVPAADWKAYKKWTDAINLGFDMYIQLVRAGGKGQAASKGTAAGHVSSEEVETLITQAFSALQKSDVQTAERLLKKARSDDPQARRLYTAEGWLAIERGKPNEAVDDFNKELAAYPRAYEVYTALARAQVMRKDKAAAEAALRQWAAEVPTAVDPEEQLASMLMNDNQAPEAVEAATKALANAGKDNHTLLEELQLLLGQAQLKADMKDKGEATLTALLKETDSPLIMNDASYELSNADLDLPLDEEKCRLALKKMDAETQSWTLDEMPATLAQKSSLLVAAWDTMGWILFREGKFQEAKSYIQPAWLNQHHDEVKGHLDQVDDKLGVAHDASGKKQDQQDRTFQLGEYKGPKVTAEYRLLLTHGKAERVAATGDKSVPEAESLLRQASFAQLFPAGSDAKLVRTGFVNCGSGKCELVLEP
jgi:tetratricopeptide (TPR) repeat protein